MMQTVPKQTNGLSYAHLHLNLSRPISGQHYIYIHWLAMIN